MNIFGNNKKQVFDLLTTAQKSTRPCGSFNLHNAEDLSVLKWLRDNGFVTVVDITTIPTLGGDDIIVDGSALTEEGIKLLDRLRDEFPDS
jgi:hypothetical protein